MVLGVYCNGRYGSLGMSRRQDLMDKPLTHRTLGDLVAEFESSYRKYQHSLTKVVGGVMEGRRGGRLNRCALSTGEDRPVRAS